MTNRSPLFIIVCLTVVICFFTVLACRKTTRPFECRDNITCVELAPSEPVRIGVLQALSGKVAALGQEQLRGFGLAIDKWKGEILGHPIKLQTEDTGCSAEGGANAALKIIADPQTVAILGTTCSVAAATASQAMSDAGLTMISGNNSAPFLTAIAGMRAPHWQSGFFRTASNEEASGKAAALFAFEKLGIRTAATINDGDIYTTGLTDGFEKSFTNLGGKIVLTASVEKGDKEMRPVLTAVINAGARMLFFPLFQPEGNEVLSQARRMPGFKDIVLMGGGAMIEASFINAARSNAIGMYFVGPARPTGAAVEALARAYKAKFHTPPATSYYLNAYDAADLLFAAIKKTAVADADGTLHIGRQALRDTLCASRGFNGVTGPLNCDEFGDCAYPVFNVLQLKDPRAGVAGLQSNVKFTYSPEN